MELKWIIFVVMLWVVTSLLVGVAQGVMIGGAVDPVTGEPQATSIIDTLEGGSFTERVGALGNMLTFNFPEIFAGGWAILRWIFFLPFVIAFAVMALGYALSHIPVIGRGS